MRKRPSGEARPPPADPASGRRWRWETRSKKRSLGVSNTGAVGRDRLVRSLRTSGQLRFKGHSSINALVGDMKPNWHGACSVGTLSKVISVDANL